MKRETRIYEASDYAGIYVGDYHFYFGYEVVYCNSHEKFTDSGECECENTEWVFEVKKGGEVVCQYKQSELEGFIDNPDSMANYLLAGMAKMLAEGKLKLY